MIPWCMLMFMLFCCRMDSVPEMYAVIVKVEANDEDITSVMFK